MEPIAFLDGISGFVRTSTTNSADKPIKIAVIDPDYDPFVSPYPDAVPLPRVTFEGETTLSGKTYPVASGYVPQPEARVYMVPIGTTYLIAGAVTGYAAQGFTASPDGSYYGVEFGDGSYFDSVSGLFLLTDAEIQGDLTVSGIGAYLHKHRTTDGTPVINSVVLLSDSVLFLDLGVGVWEVNAHIIYSAGNTQDMKSGWAFTGTWSGTKHARGVSPFQQATTATVQANNEIAGAARNSAHPWGDSVQYGRTSSGTALGSLHETAVMNVTVAGRWTFQYAQRVALAGNQTIIRAGSFINARRVE